MKNRVGVAGASVALFFFSLLSTAYTFRNRSIGQTGTRLVLGAVSPFQSLNKAVVSRLSGLFESYVLLVKVKEENEDLKGRLANLEGENSSLVEFQRENRRLRRLLSMKDETGLGGVTARVIGRNPSNWVESITVDRGSADGVEVGHAVVDGRGVVGQVTVVTANTAQVLLITDPSSGVDAIVQGSRARGVVTGKGQGKPCVMRYLPGGEGVRVGERIITSGMDKIYPKGLIIAKVSNLKGESNEGMFQSVEVKPTADMAGLEEVTILTGKRAETRSSAGEELREGMLGRGREH